MREPLHVHMCTYTHAHGRWGEEIENRTMGDGVGQMNSSENRGDHSREADPMDILMMGVALPEPQDKQFPCVSHPACGSSL